MFLACINNSSICELDRNSAALDTGLGLHSFRGVFLHQEQAAAMCNLPAGKPGTQTLS